MADELPPIVDSSKYLVVRDQYGTEKVIALPSTPSVLVFDGTDLKWSGNAIPLSAVTPAVANAASTGALVLDGAGKLVRLASGAMDSVVRLFSFKNQVPTLDTLANLLGTGKGLLYKNAAGVLAWLGGGGAPGIGEGVYWAKADGTVVLVSTSSATNGQSLTLTPAGLAFTSPSGVTATSNSGVTGLSDVFAQRLTTATVNVKVPSLSLSDNSGGGLQANGVDLTFTAGTTGPGGVDVVGGLTASHFYFLYVIAKADGTLALLASLDNSAPDLTLSADYDFFGLASIFYVRDDGNIRLYVQRGKSFWQEETVWVDNWITPATYTSVPGTVALGSLVPTGFVKTVSGRIGGGTAETLARQYWLASDNTGIGAIYVGSAAESFNGLKLTSGHFDRMPIINPSVPVLYGKVTATAASVKTKIIINGFTI